jgi:hypothetical protein
VTKTAIETQAVPKPERDSLRNDIRSIPVGGQLTLSMAVVTDCMENTPEFNAVVHAAKAKIRNRYNRLVFDARKQTGKTFVTTSSTKTTDEEFFVTFTITCTAGASA